jgi:hypothetical protein
MFSVRLHDPKHVPCGERRADVLSRMRLPLGRKAAVHEGLRVRTRQRIRRRVERCGRLEADVPFDHLRFAAEELDLGVGPPHSATTSPQRWRRGRVHSADAPRIKADHVMILAEQGSELLRTTLHEVDLEEGEHGRPPGFSPARRTPEPPGPPALKWTSIRADDQYKVIH